MCNGLGAVYAEFLCQFAQQTHTHLLAVLELYTTICNNMPLICCTTVANTHGNIKSDNQQVIFSSRKKNHHISLKWVLPKQHLCVSKLSIKI